MNCAASRPEPSRTPLSNSTNTVGGHAGESSDAVRGEERSGTVDATDCSHPASRPEGLRCKSDERTVDDRMHEDVAGGGTALLTTIDGLGVVAVSTMDARATTITGRGRPSCCRGAPCGRGIGRRWCSGCAVLGAGQLEEAPPVDTQAHSPPADCRHRHLVSLDGVTLTNQNTYGEHRVRSGMIKSSITEMTNSLSTGWARIMS